MTGRLVALLAAAMLAGCAADRISGVPPPRQDAPTRFTKAGCAFTVETVDDLRGDDSLGALGLRPVSGEGFMRWFKQQLMELPGYGGAPPRTVLRVDVLKAYVQGLSTLKSANIVVRVRYVSAAKPEPTVKVYRGVEGTVNWANSESEAQAALQGAWADLRRQLAADLAASCRA